MILFLVKKVFQSLRKTRCSGSKCCTDGTLSGQNNFSIVLSVEIWTFLNLNKNFFTKKFQFYFGINDYLGH